jgi:hypothetical protein
MDGAMRYREGYWREDVENFRKSLEQGANNEEDNHADRGWRRRRQKAIDSIVHDYKCEAEKFNKGVYSHIDSIINQMGGKAKLGFDNYATGAAKMIEEYVKAGNTVEILTVCQLYNQGFMREVFETLKKSEQAENIQDTE